MTARVAVDLEAVGADEVLAGVEVGEQAPGALDVTLSASTGSGIGTGPRSRSGRSRPRRRTPSATAPSPRRSMTERVAVDQITQVGLVDAVAGGSSSAGHVTSRRPSRRGRACLPAAIIRLVEGLGDGSSSPSHSSRRTVAVVLASGGRRTRRRRCRSPTSGTGSGSPRAVPPARSSISTTVPR